MQRWASQEKIDRLRRRLDGEIEVVMTTVLKNENGALTVQVPKEIVDALNLTPGSALDVFVEGDRIILQPRTATFSLEQLIGAEAPRQQEVELEQVLVETIPASRG